VLDRNKKEVIDEKKKRQKAPKNILKLQKEDFPQP
jgi:hypothetical protein